MLQSVCASAAEQFFRSRAEEGGWDPEGYRQWLMQHFPVTFEEGYFDHEYLDIADLEKMAVEKIIQAFKEKIESEKAKLPPPPAHLQQEEKPRNPAHEAVRNLMIRKIDRLWQEHLLVMDHLRSDVNLRTVGQRDPLTEFKHEAFALFEEFSKNLRTEIAHDLFRFEMIVRPLPTIEQLMSVLRMETNRSFLPELEQQPSPQPPIVPQRREIAEEEEQEGIPEPVVAGPRVGRNDLCPCGSGKKYKKCCGQGKDD